MLERFTFSQGERARLEAAGFAVSGDTAVVRGATVTITAAGEDGVSTTTITLPNGSALRLAMRFGADN